MARIRLPIGKSREPNFRTALTKINQNFIELFRAIKTLSEGVVEYSANTSAPNQGNAIEVDVNNNDWTGHPYANGDSLQILENHIVTFGNDTGIAYKWIGSKPVLLGGTSPDYTSTASDYVALGSSDHQTLTNVLPDDHHAKLHNHNGLDGSGLVSYNDLTDQPVIPPQNFLHDALTDVSADQHHPQLHILDSHTDVNAPTPEHGQRLAWESSIQEWIPKTSNSGLSIVAFHYRMELPPTTPPASGRVSRNNADPNLTTVLYLHEIGDDGTDQTQFWGEIKEHDWFNIYKEQNTGDHESYDVTGSAVDMGTYWEVPVQIYTVAGSPITDNTKVGILWRISPNFPHAVLVDRDAPGSHPIAAITDLQTTLDGKEPANANIQSHIADVTTNPHNVTYQNIGGTAPPIQAHDLDSHTDVTITSPVNQQALTYDGTIWKNSALPSGVTDHNALNGVTEDQHHPKLHLLGSHTDTNILTPNHGDVIVWDQVTGKWIGAGNFVGDNTLINPDFRINQRGFDGNWAALPANITGYDRWRKSGGIPHIYQFIEPGSGDTVLGTYTLSWEGGGAANGYIFDGDAGGTLLVSGLSPLTATLTDFTNSGGGIQVPDTATNIKFEFGTVATPYVPRHYQQELSLCHRYYWQTWQGNDTTDLVAASHDGTLAMQTSDGNKFIHSSNKFPTEMRVAPVFTTYSSQTFTPNTVHTTTDGEQAVQALIYLTKQGISGVTTVNTLSPDARVRFHLKADAEF